MKSFPKHLSLTILVLALFACSEEAVTVEQATSIAPETDMVDSFRMRNAEIRQDIVNELTSQNIEHWINEDGSIGFNSEDAERVDAIGFAAIGAYAARN